MTEAIIRAATPADLPVILELIRELATYERADDQVISTVDDLSAALFDTAQPAVWCHLVEDGSGIAGLALWFLNFSTWTGHHGIYVEDLVIRKAARGKGYGRALIAHLAQICTSRGYQRIDLSVLDWNLPAIDFYRSLGAVHQADWDGYRLEAQALVALSSK